MIIVVVFSLLCHCCWARLGRTHSSFTAQKGIFLAVKFALGDEKSVDNVLLWALGADPPKTTPHVQLFGHITCRVCSTTSPITVFDTYIVI